MSANVRKSRNGAFGVVEKSKEVDIFCWQEIPLDRDGKTFRMEGYVMIGGVGGIGGGGDGIIDGKGVVGMMVHEKWEGKFGVVKRSKKVLGMPRLRYISTDL